MNDMLMINPAPKEFTMPTPKTQSPEAAQIARNLAVVDAHMRGEGTDPASIMSLYGQGIVLEIPARGLVFDTPEAIEANYRRMFSAIKLLRLMPIERFATLDRVVDETLVDVEIIGHGYDNLPYPIGARLEIRLLHIFHMKAGKIIKEIVYEAFTLLP